MPAVDRSRVTLLAGRVLDPQAAPVPLRWWRRAWAAPAWTHLLGLAAILLVLVPVVGTSQSFLADEGAAIIQARSLAAGHGWLVGNPLPEVDPTGAWYPVVNAEQGQKGFAPLAKHPAYSLLAAGADRVGGVTGIILLSLAGTLAAAGLAAALAGRIDGSLVRPTLWVVGLASPMLFDGFLSMAHTLGAALATAAVLAAVVAVQDHRPAVALWVAPAVAGAVLLRSEALLFAAALALVRAVVAIRREYRVPDAVVAGTAVAAALGARLVERVWIARITGGAVAATSVGVPAAGGSFVRGRVDGFLMTWLNPAYGGSVALRLCLLVMLPAIGWCAYRARAYPEDRAEILSGAALAAGAAVAAAVMEPGNVVPGLLIAFPLATAGMLVLRRQLFATVGPVVIAATAALYACAVLATQYAEGGNGEWGGRYFALLVPAAVPVLLAGLRLQGRALAPAVRRGAVAALVVCSVALSTMAIGGLRTSHEVAARVAARIDAAGRMTGDPRPVVLTTWVGGARQVWPTFDDHRWLYVPRTDVAAASGRLQAAGVHRFLFVTFDLEADRPQLAGFAVVSTDGPAGGYQILVLES